MTHPDPKREVNPLRHRCYMTKGRIGFISFLDMSDIAVVVSAFYLGLTLADKLFTSPLPKFACMIVITVAAYLINFRIKRMLLPFPKIAENFLNWWFSGIEFYAPEIDANPIPLVITDELRASDAIEKAARNMKVTSATRRKRVRKAKKILQ